ncbi:MAG: CBS domain-containing protein [Euryarchaeota archaeon]|nr:CBS domain-containing protein [Euryarchaeota archaeon]
MEIPTGGYLRQWRKSLGLTQAALAERSGLTQSVIAKVETESVDPRASTLRKMVGALNREEHPNQAHTVGDIMVSEVTTLLRIDTVQSAIDKMVLGGISHLPVLGDAGSVVGLVSEASLLKGNVGRDVCVDEVMRTDYSMVDVDISVEEARRLLGEKEVLLVNQRGILVGLVGRIDMVRALRETE